MSFYYRKAFLLDDDPIANFLLETTLKEHSIAQQIVSFTSFQPLLLAFQELPQSQGAEAELLDLLLLDLNMPERDGLEVLDAIRQIPGIGGSKVCVFLMSATENHRLEAKIGEYSISGFLVKPLREEAMQQLIESGTKQTCELKEISPQ